MESREVIALVVNPRAAAADSPAWGGALDRLRREADLRELPTAGDGANVERVARLLDDAHPAVVVAAGGDGTVHDVIQAILRRADPPVLAMVPLGTANNVARSLGLRSLRQADETAADLAVSTVLAGVPRPIDVGRCGESFFIGSFALGMDADILATRNALRGRHRSLRGKIGGYPLYLWSCAANLARQHHGGRAALCVDGITEECLIYNLLITNTPIYAGEFRFDAEPHVDDGQLDLHLCSGPVDYVRQFASAWRRHLRFAAGHPVEAPRLRRLREVQIELAAPVTSQLDGEQWQTADRFAVSVVPRAITVRMPS